ncbi:MAG: DUF3798 domain-containing protein [Oscillospiraceae bacterium]|nr:DUF3798 domain-containing protein [Oscillospiraceae bacterium]
MLKKGLCILMVLLMIVPVFAACRAQEAPIAATPEPTPEAQAPAETETPEDEDDGVEIVEAGDWLIGIVTGTVSQGEEEFMAGQKMLERHGSDRIMTVTYPDRFSEEIETTIAQTMGLVDAGVDAIVFNQAVIGSLPALQRARDRNPDLLIVVGTIAEPPRELAEVADVILQSDDIGMGTAVMEQAAAQGATTFIHYSFPRHLGIEMIARRRELLMESAERLGIEFIDVMAPDPTGDAGLPGTQQFVVEDVPRQIEEHGPDTAFFATNCGMQEPLIRGIMEQGAIYPQPCCPSPFHAMPAAFNIDVTGNEGNVPWMIDQINAAVSEAGMAGRISNWGVPVNMLNIEAGVAYAIEYLEGRTNGRFDPAAVQRALDAVLAEYHSSVRSVTNFEDEEGTLPNMFMILGDFVNFG